MTTHDDDDGITLRANHKDDAEAFELALRITAGPDRAAYEGKAFALAPHHAAPHLVGQGAACDLRLTDRSASRRHAALDAGTFPVRVRDLSSTNGTFVNGVAIVEAKIFGGETLRIGDTTLRVERLAARKSPRLPDLEAFGRVLGASPAMRRLYPKLETLAQGSATILLEGEAGAGKELLAEALHERGPRAARPFLVVDGALGGRELQKLDGERPFETLLAQTRGGTLLIDEVSDLDATMQRKLAQMLDARDANGENGPLDGRVFVATRKSLDWLAQNGRFREDLAERLAGCRVELPPLRARQGDVSLLAFHFWREAGGSQRSFPSEVFARAEAYAWPGNVRELRDTVVRLLTLAADGAPASTPPNEPWTAGVGASIERLLRADLAYADARRRVLHAFERHYVTRMLEAHQGNVTRAAAASGLARRNFQLIRARGGDDD